MSNSANCTSLPVELKSLDSHPTHPPDSALGGYMIVSPLSSFLLQRQLRKLDAVFVVVVVVFSGI